MMHPSIIAPEKSAYAPNNLQGFYMPYQSNQNAYDYDISTKPKSRGGVMQEDAKRNHSPLVSRGEA